MKNEPCLIYDDPRPIRGLYHDGEDAGAYTVGRGRVTKILAYKEHGQGDFVPYYAVYFGDDHLAVRVPGHMVTVTYQEPA